MSAEEKEDISLKDDGDQLLTEDSTSSSFGVAQGLVWGFVKTLVLLVFLVGTGWVIWGDGLRDNLPHDALDEGKKLAEDALKIIPDIDQEKERPPDYYSSQQENRNMGDKKSTDESIDDDNLVSVKTEPVVYRDPVAVVRRSFRLESVRQQNIQESDIFAQSVRWLRFAKNIGEISPQILRIQDPSQRAKKIESVLRQSERILSIGEDLKQTLRTLLYTEQQNIDAYQQKSTELDQRIFEKISTYTEHDLRALVLAKIAADQKAIQAQVLYQYYESFYKNIENYQRLIRQKQIPLISPGFEIRNPQ